MSTVARSALLLILFAFAVLAAACAQPPTQSESADGAGGKSEVAAECDPAAYEEVEAEIEGLDEEQRRERLMELAAQEEGTLQVYGSIGGDEIGPLMDDFHDKSGADLDSAVYRAGSDALLLRLTQEAQAGLKTADVTIGTGIDMFILSNQGFLQPFETPYTEGILDTTINKDWAGVYLNVYAAAWNTEQADAATAPTTWEEVFAFDGPVGIEVKSYDWFATLITEYFMAEKGMSEEEAVKVFTDAADSYVPINGRSALTELLSAGEFPLAAATYTQNVDSAIEDGAPVAWKPAVEPLVMRPNGAAPMCDSDMPASALLFVDYLLSEDGQKMMVSFERIPTRTSVKSAMNPEEFEVVNVNLDEMVNNRDKWIDLYAKVTGEAEGE